MLTLIQFLSTLSLRRATIVNETQAALDALFLSTLSLRRATYQAFCKYLDMGISIHALLAESDPPKLILESKDALFLSTLSLRRATPPHPPVKCRRYNFYPRSPCGERLELNSPWSQSDNISIHALLAESDCICFRK